MSDRLRSAICVLLAVGLVLSSTAVAAQDQRAQFMVSVRVIGDCRIHMPHSPLRVPAAGVVGLYCARNTSYTVSLASAGNPASLTRSFGGTGSGSLQVIPIFRRGSGHVDGAQPAADGHAIIVKIDY
jgi:spore coat protein U-like protein